MSDDLLSKVLLLYPRIFFALHTRHVRDPVLGQELTAHQASLLDHLDAERGVHLTDLARHLGVTAGTMSVAVERLVRLGYVEREVDAEDRRRVRLRLTADGVRIRNGKSVLDPERLQRALARLTPPQRA